MSALNKLLPQHLEELHKSGLTDVTIAKYEIISITQEEASRLSKELAHISSLHQNEREITVKTQQLLEEYRGLMSASMDQLWKNFAPQEAEIKKELQDRITALEHDNAQLSRLRLMPRSRFKPRCPALHHPIISLAAWVSSGYDAYALLPVSRARPAQ